MTCRKLCIKLKRVTESGALRYLPISRSHTLRLPVRSFKFLSQKRLLLLGGGPEDTRALTFEVYNAVGEEFPIPHHLVSDVSGDVIQKVLDKVLRFDPVRIGMKICNNPMP
jgi:hypothetical protein